MNSFEMPGNKEWQEIEDPELPEDPDMKFSYRESIDVKPGGDFFKGRFFTVEVDASPTGSNFYMVRIMDADKGVVISPTEDKFLWKRIWEEFKRQEIAKVKRRKKY